MAHTGDIVLFRRDEGLLDKAIRWFTSSPYTHVGVLLEDPPGLPKGLHVIESSVEPTVDEVTGHKVFGVQVQPLEALRDSHGIMSVRSLEISGDRSDLTKKLTRVEQGVNGKPYDTSVGDWLRAEMRVLDPKVIWEQRTDQFWCSALAAYLYVQLGLLPQSVPWTLVAPCEWAPGGMMERLLLNCKLGPERPYDVAPVQGNSLESK